MRELSLVQALHFRDELRSARAAALKDAEGFDQILKVAERIGQYRHGYPRNLGSYKACIQEIAEASPLDKEIPTIHRQYHTPFSILYDLVKDGRNDFAHEGAYARHLTTHAVELSLVLEDALSVDAKVVRDYMVPDPATAELWQPLSFARQKMLVNAYSFLPVFWKNGANHLWMLLSDRNLARHLRPLHERKSRLGMTLVEALESESIVLNMPLFLQPADSVERAIEQMENQPALIVERREPERLLGILTAYDLL